MLFSTADLARAHWLAWSREDLDASMACFTDDVVFAMYVPQHVLPFGGETTGKPAAADRGRMVFQQFHVAEYVAEITGASDQIVRGHIRYRFRHRATGEEIDGTLRHVLTARGNLFCRLEEYHDADKIAAFMRLISWKAQ